MTNLFKKINSDLVLVLSEYFKESTYITHKVLAHCSIFSMIVLSFQKFFPKAVLQVPLLYIAGLLTVLRLIQLFNVKKSDLSKLGNIFICLYMISFIMTPVLAQKALFSITILTLVSFWSDVSSSFILHSILPSKAKRTKQAKALIQQERVPARVIVKQKWEINNYILDLSSFSEKYFQRSDKTLIRFLGERIGSNKNSSIALQTWCLMIPKNVTTDTLKALIGVNRVDETMLNYYAELYELKIEDKQDLIDNLFSNYSESQIRRIFTTNFSILDYKAILSTKLKYTDFILPLESRFKDVMNYMQHFIDNKSGLANLPIAHSDRFLLETKNIAHSSYSFFPITTTLELYNWGTALENCLHSYTKTVFTANSIFLIGVKKDNEEWACIQVSNLQVVQIKKTKNIDLNPSEVEEIKKLLKPFNLAFQTNIS